ncbi:MAG: type II secretion system F family protein [Clostridiaceae bacterium]|nr:type II secretion system F family protein [Clostridiaceae bacterium]
MNTTYFIFMVVFILLYIILNQSVKFRYSNELELVDIKEYNNKIMLPVGMWLYDELNIPSTGSYYVFLYQRIVMVYGTRNASFFLKIHWAEKFLYFFLGIVVASFIGAVSNSDISFTVVILILGIALFFLADKNLDDRAKKRKLQFMLEFPGFLSKLTLLMNAGMHLRHALIRIYNDSLKNTPLYEEIGVVLEDFDAGISESQAWQEFSERCKVKEITSFANMIVQNSKIGGNKLVNELKIMSHETWEMRKHAVKQMGETASTKLILPMMLMFVAILLIAVAPAIMQFSFIY